MFSPLGAPHDRGGVYCICVDTYTVFVDVDYGNIPLRTTDDDSDDDDSDDDDSDARGWAAARRSVVARRLR